MFPTRRAAGGKGDHAAAGSAHHWVWAQCVSLGVRRWGVSESQDPPEKLPRALGGPVRTLLIVRLLCTQCASAQASSSPDTSSTKLRKSICTLGSLKGNEAPKGMSTESPNCLLSSASPVLANPAPSTGPQHGPLGSVLPWEGVFRALPSWKGRGRWLTAVHSTASDQSQTAWHTLALCCNTFPRRRVVFLSNEYMPRRRAPAGKS